MIYAGSRDDNKGASKTAVGGVFLFAKSVDKEFLTW